MGLAAGSSTDPFQLGLSDKGAKDFKRAMGSIESAGKDGTLLSISKLFSLLQQFGGGPFVENITNLIDLVKILSDSATAEAAARLNKELIMTSDNIKQLDEQTKELGKVANAVTDIMIRAKKGWDSWMVSVDKFDTVTMPKVRAGFDQFIIDFDQFGKDLGVAIINGMIEGTENKMGEMVDIGEAIVGVIKDGLEEALDDLDDWLEDLVEEILD